MGDFESRHLPAAHAERLADLQKQPRTVDGRSASWVEALAETGFVTFTAERGKRRTIISVAITPRGLVALERDARGVDPYLVLT